MTIDGEAPSPIETLPADRRQRSTEPPRRSSCRCAVPRPTSLKRRNLQRRRRRSGVGLAQPMLALVESGRCTRWDGGRAAWAHDEGGRAAHGAAATVMSQSQITAVLPLGMSTTVLRRLAGASSGAGRTSIPRSVPAAITNLPTSTTVPSLPAAKSSIVGGGGGSCVSVPSPTERLPVVVALVLLERTTSRRMCKGSHKRYVRERARFFGGGHPRQRARRDVCNDVCDAILHSEPDRTAFVPSLRTVS